MTSKSERLCIITPDSFYAVLLKEASFPTFETRVIKGIELLQLLAAEFIPDAFLLFGSQLGPVLSSNLLIEIRHKFPKAQIFQVEGVRQPTIHLIWPSSKTRGSASGMDASSVELIDAAMRKLIEPELASGEVAPKLTRNQLGVIRDLAAGFSNAEMAASRNTTLRAVETLILRALRRIGLNEPANSRTKVILAQKYLLSLGDDSFWFNPSTD